MIARTAGTLCWNRLKLERSLPDSDGRDRLWLATDVHTGELQAVEFLPPGRANAYGPPHPLHPSLLAFYRFEGGSEERAAVFAYHPLLETPPLSGLPAGLVDPATAVRWAMSIGRAAAVLHDAGLRAHGAIVPAHIRVGAETPPLLTGYPVAGDAWEGIPAGHLSAQRRAGSDPVPSDDIYGVGALLYFLLTGRIFSSDDEAKLDFVIDDIRRGDGLAPTGWSSGWEKPLRSSLARMVSFRPASMRALVDELGAVLQPPREPPAVNTPPCPIRRTPSWHRARGSRLLQRLEPASVAIENVTVVSAQDARIELLRAEVEQSRETVAADVAAAKNARADAERRIVDLEAERSAVNAARTKLEADRRALDQSRQAADDLQQRLALQQQAQAAVEAEQARRAAELTAERARLEQWSLQLEQKRGAISPQLEKFAKLEQKLALTEQRLAQAGWELEQRGRAFADAQDEKSALRGDPNQAVRPTVTTAGGADLPSVKDAPSPVEANRPAPVCRTTLSLRSGRRLHLFCGPAMRFGRHAESDFLLVALVRGRSPNIGASREISRKHFELQISAGGLRIIDGWSDEGKASQHGVCVNGRRVPLEGAELRHGTILSVTTRAPGGSVPHWRISLVPTSAPPVRVGAGESGLTAPSAGFLRRLDDAPDDLCIFLESVPLRSLDPDEPENSNIVLHRTPEGIAWVDGSQSTLLTEGSSPAPGIMVVAVGRLVPFGAIQDTPNTPQGTA